MMMISVVVFMRGRLLQRLGPVHLYLTAPTAHPSGTSRVFAQVEFAHVGSHLWAESCSLRQRGARSIGHKASSLLWTSCPRVVRLPVSGNLSDVRAFAPSLVSLSLKCEIKDLCPCATFAAPLNTLPLPKLLHSIPRGFTLPPVGVTSAFRRPQDTLMLSRHQAACPVGNGV